ncbi:MAG: hypothetical protein ABF624_01595 [Liquorilactobacillus ghanensis]|uniref:hypothetical protein n=1 Tax=Liquorilactobacillus ghanensis TaxID=399370 RepID=UPI0039EBB6A6
MRKEKIKFVDCNGEILNEMDAVEYEGETYSIEKFYKGTAVLINLGAKARWTRRAFDRISMQMMKKVRNDE